MNSDGPFNKKQRTLDRNLKGPEGHPDPNLHTVLHGDVYACLTRLADNSIDCAVTSPPYWSQRDYEHEHQIGNESDLMDYIAKLVTIYAQLRQKMHQKGIFYHNIGDKYLNKYGNTPLGMIPYLLSYCMVQNGWILVDTIIWYKPNHMPSSVGNRFTNTYEPVFVFAKNRDNYYAEYQRDHSHSNIVKIPLQQITYAHMATYPEKLVESLLEFGIPPTGVVLDPFAGSGTTCKSVQNLNGKSGQHRKSIMIEAQPDYVQIILERCTLPPSIVTQIPYLDYEIPRLVPPSVPVPVNLPLEAIYHAQDELVILNWETESEYQKQMPYLFDDAFQDTLADDGLLVVRLPDHTIEKIFTVMNAKRWIIRNMLVVADALDWIPCFFLVKDTKRIEYKFNLDAIRVTSRSDLESAFHEIDFTGYKVIRSSTYFDHAQEGLIIQILSRKPNGLPHWVAVKWKDGSITPEEVLNYPLLERKTEFSCPQCRTVLKKFHHPRKILSCPQCGLGLWQDPASIPLIAVDAIHQPPFDPASLVHLTVAEKDTRKDYDGKFKDAKRVNMGQSPGARSSVAEQYFSVQRYYDVSQPLVADYLNLKRLAVGISKSALTARFPPEYKHTCGHWFRKDMGGSIPTTADLMKLHALLQLDAAYLQYISRFGIKLQIVQANQNGKNPGDFLEQPVHNIFEMFKKIVET